MSGQRSGSASVWLVDPDALHVAGSLDLYWSWLSDEERERASRFAHQADQRLSVAGHALVRWALSKATPTVPPQRWRFLFGAHGRPEIDREAVGCAEDLRFNLSHTSGLVACVVTTGRECGIDVERTDRAASIERLARRVLTQRERADVAAQPSERRQQRFLAHWVVKEAYLKARGLGVSVSPRGLELKLPSVLSDEPAEVGAGFSVPIEDSASDWQLLLSTVSGGHLLAVAQRATDRAQRRVVIRSVVPEPLATSRSE